MLDRFMRRNKLVNLAFKVLIEVWPAVLRGW